MSKRENSSLKEEAEESSPISKKLKKSKPECQYGKNCYRRSPSHFQEFSHFDLEKIFNELQNSQHDFSTLPPQYFNSGFSDTDVLLQQLVILKNLTKNENNIDENSQAISNSINSSSTSLSINHEKINHFTNIKNEETILSSSSIEKETRSFSYAQKNQKSQINKKGTILEKWEKSCPYNFFLTSLPSESDGKKSYSLKFIDLFDPSLGQVNSICHFNFMIEANWFLEQTTIANLVGVETILLYGVHDPELDKASKVFPWLQTHVIKSPFPFGHHHTKMTLIEYRDESMRFVVSTANLIESDWENRTQGLWISPKCSKSTQEEREEMTSLKCIGNFKADLLQYLQTYPPNIIQNWISKIRALNCSPIKVCFVGSAPTSASSSSNGFQWGSKKIEKLLKSFKNFDEVGPTWPIILQCSSIASLGPNNEWVCGELGKIMSGNSGLSSMPPVKLIYPTDKNVRGSFDGLSGGGCLPYSKNTHLKQTWVTSILHQWESRLRGRSRAMPHIKTYCRISPDFSKIAWFLLTSANLSKAAWGKLTKKHERLSVMSWEAGIFFHPSLFGLNAPFEIWTDDEDQNFKFLLPYDVPCKKYESSDTPWFMDTLLELRK